MKKIVIYIFVVLSVLLGLQRSYASVSESSENDLLLNLDLRVFIAGKPIHLILVEKDLQRLRVLEHDGRIRTVVKYEAATGENSGRKKKEGDSRTPEGLYFITKIYNDSKITVFGKRAFQLNYPNVFDRELGNSGSGIFVHGTNRNLKPNSTNGCITLRNGDIEKLVQYLRVGSIPVVVVSSLNNLIDPSSTSVPIPSFVANGFATAKKWLLADGVRSDQAVFNSLYLIRAVGQMVAVGEYQTRDDNGVITVTFCRSYLHYSAKEEWTRTEYFAETQNQTRGPALALVTGMSDLLVEQRDVAKQGPLEQASNADNVEKKIPVTPREERGQLRKADPKERKLEPELPSFFPTMNWQLAATAGFSAFLIWSFMVRRMKKQAKILSRELAKKEMDLSERITECSTLSAKAEQLTVLEVELNEQRKVNQDLIESRKDREAALVREMEYLSRKLAKKEMDLSERIEECNTLSAKAEQLTVLEVELREQCKVNQNLIESGKERETTLVREIKCLSRKLAQQEMDIKERLAEDSTAAVKADQLTVLEVELDKQRKVNQDLIESGKEREATLVREIKCLSRKLAQQEMDIKERITEGGTASVKAKQLTVLEVWLAKQSKDKPYLTAVGKGQDNILSEEMNRLSRKLDKLEKERDDLAVEVDSLAAVEAKLKEERLNNKALLEASRYLYAEQERKFNELAARLAKAEQLVASLTQKKDFFTSKVDIRKVIEENQGIDSEPVKQLEYKEVKTEMKEKEKEEFKNFADSLVKAQSKTNLPDDILKNWLK